MSDDRIANVVRVDAAAVTDEQRGGRLLAPALEKGSLACELFLWNWREQNAQRGAVEGQDGGKVSDKPT